MDAPDYIPYTHNTSHPTFQYPAWPDSFASASTSTSGHRTLQPQMHATEPDSEPTSSFAQTLREADAVFYATFPQSKPQPSTSNPWVYETLPCGSYFQGGSFYYDVNGTSCSNSTIKSGYSASSEVAPSTPDDHHCHAATVKVEQVVSPSPPLDLNYDYTYESSSQQYSYANDSTTSTPSFDEPSPSGMHSRNDWAKQRSSGHDPAGLADDSQPAQFVKAEPIHESIPPAPALPAFDEEIPAHMVVPSQRSLVDIKVEIRRQQQFGSPVSMHRPYQQTDQPYMDYLPSPQSPTDHHSPSYMASHASSSSSSSLLSPFHDGDDYPMGMRRNSDFAESPTASWSSLVPGTSKRLLAPAPLYPQIGTPSPPAQRPDTPITSSSSSSSSSSRRHSHRPREHRSHSHSHSHTHSLPHTHSHSHSHKHSSIRPLGWLSRRSPSPRASMRLSPLPSKRPAEKKPPLACLFCRGRKIACGPPLPGSKDRTCNQCQRRSLKCEYPLESRRGMRKKKTATTNVNADGPKVTLTSTRKD